MKSKPAFPQSVSTELDGSAAASYDFENGEGMSLLEYYAGQAMVGFLANRESFEYLGLTARGNQEVTLEIIKNLSFNIAEAMVGEAEKRELKLERLEQRK